MRTLFIFLLLVILFAGCSRESDIVPNPGFKDTRFVVMVLRQRPDSLDKFIDSIARLDTVVQDDTVGFTVNDTVYLLGYKYRNGEKVFQYTWRIDSMAPIRGKNGDIYPVVFPDSGTFRTLLSAEDLSTGRDSAGTNQYVRIVKDPPVVHVLKDTVWARNAFPAQVPLHASDLYGRVERIRLDYDADGDWDSTFAYISADTVWASMSQIAGAMDSLGNQKAIVQAEDDDGQTHNDTLILHFNRLPIMALDYPFDSSRVSINERFALYYHATDSDNPESIRYFIRAGKSPDYSGTRPVLTNTNLIYSNTVEKSLEIRDQNLLFNPALDSTLRTFLRGVLYWQVW